MKKVIMTTLSLVAAFALVTGVAVNGSAQATVLGKTDPTTSKPLTYSDGNHWSWSSSTVNSDVYDYGSEGHNREIAISITNSNTMDLDFLPVELTGSGSYNDYFDCNGNEVYSSNSACVRTISPNKTIEFTVKMGDSSWFKDRDGVFLSGPGTLNAVDTKNYNGFASYTMTTVQS
jgi:hypothetical protein